MRTAIVSACLIGASLIITSTRPSIGPAFAIGLLLGVSFTLVAQGVHEMVTRRSPR